jgi:ADP-heptose:LPS heptosyltransferase
MTAVVARLDSAGDVLITGPAVRAVASRHGPVVFVAGPRGSEAARLLPAVADVIEWQAPWVDFDSRELTSGHVESLVKQLRDVGPDRMFIFTSFHQSPLPLALIGRMAGVPWIGAISEDYPGTLLDLRHHAEPGVPEPERALSLVSAAGCALPSGDDGALSVDVASALPPISAKSPGWHRMWCFTPVRRCPLGARRSAAAWRWCTHSPPPATGCWSPATTPNAP